MGYPAQVRRPIILLVPIDVVAVHILWPFSVKGGRDNQMNHMVFAKQKHENICGNRPFCEMEECDPAGLLSFSPMANRVFLSYQARTPDV